MDPLLLLIAATSLAALVSGISGPVFQGLTRGTASPRLGWANAVAAGLMLGAAFSLALQGWQDGPGLAFGLGALTGIILGIFVYARQDATSWDGVYGVENTDERREATHAALARHAIHAAPEGVALGVAAFGNLGLGLFLVAALAAHNVAEGLSLVTASVESGRSSTHGAGGAVLSNLPQVFFAAAAFKALNLFPYLYSAGVGFSVGALVFLTLVDLLPRAYRQDGAETIALVCALAMSAVPALAGLLGL